MPLFVSVAVWVGLRTRKGGERGESRGRNRDESCDHPDAVVASIRNKQVPGLVSPNSKRNIKLGAGRRPAIPAKAFVPFPATV